MPRVEPEHDGARNFLTINEFCRRNSIGRTTFYELLGAGRIRAVKLGRKTLIPLAAEREFLTALGVNPATVGA